MDSPSRGGNSNGHSSLLHRHAIFVYWRYAPPAVLMRLGRLHLQQSESMCPNERPRMAARWPVLFAFSRARPLRHSGRPFPRSPSAISLKLPPGKPRCISGFGGRLFGNANSFLRETHSLAQERDSFPTEPSLVLEKVNLVFSGMRLVVAKVSAVLRRPRLVL